MSLYVVWRTPAGEIERRIVEDGDTAAEVLISMVEYAGDDALAEGDMFAVEETDPDA